MGGAGCLAAGAEAGSGSDRRIAGTDDIRRTGGHGNGLRDRAPQQAEAGCLPVGNSG